LFHAAHNSAHRRARRILPTARKLLAGAVATALIATGLVVGVVLTPAAADTTISLSGDADATVLAGGNASVTLTASNPNATTDYFNASFRYELPADVSYVPGSSTSTSTPSSPTLSSSRSSTRQVRRRSATRC
jgi:hypothetical protein